MLSSQSHPPTNCDMCPPIESRAKPTAQLIDELLVAGASQRANHGEEVVLPVVVLLFALLGVVVIWSVAVVILAHG